MQQEGGDFKVEGRINNAKCYVDWWKIKTIKSSTLVFGNYWCSLKTWFCSVMAIDSFCKEFKDKLQRNK